MKKNNVIAAGFVVIFMWLWLLTLLLAMQAKNVNDMADRLKSQTEIDKMQTELIERVYDKQHKSN